MTGGRGPRWPRTYAEAAALAAAVRPDLAPLAPLGRGDHCHALAAAGGRVVRVARHAEAAVALRREAAVVPGLAGALALAAPRPALAEPEPGCAFAVHHAARGAALTGARWRRLPPARRDRVAAALAAFLRALHA
ncbi:phosphotransferase, partial [Roseisolibacter sp. H3M3-2]|uniref:phosphotransferase n=1 Tax=Roseisolibacter sp. H3M3-2 TaxID=3031323 RepID=UPI0023D97CA0